MLDFAHNLVLKSVARGDEDGTDEASPALRTLVETGLARRGDDGGYAITDEGRAALAAGAPTRWERTFWWFAAAAGAVVVTNIVVGWMT